MSSDKTRCSFSRFNSERVRCEGPVIYEDTSLPVSKGNYPYCEYHAGFFSTSRVFKSVLEIAVENVLIKKRGKKV